MRSLFIGALPEKIKFEDLIGKSNIQFEIGSSTVSGAFNKSELIKTIKEAIKHYFFDWDFYYNYIDERKEKEEYWNKFDDLVLSHIEKNPNKYLNLYFEINPGKFGKKNISFKVSQADQRKFIDNFFKSQKSISEKLKKQYLKHRS